jgi:hypothetical protein
MLQGVSVNSASGLTILELTAADAQTGYPGIPHNQIGVTTVGAIRAIGGDVDPSPTQANKHHAILSGVTPEEASHVFLPTLRNPNRHKK